MKLSEAFDLYKEDYILFINQSNRTLEMHEFVRKNLLEFLSRKYARDDMELADLSYAMVREWKSWLEKTRGQNTVRGYIIKLREVLGFCKKRNISCIDVDSIPVPKRKQTVPVFLTEQEVSRMITCACNIRSKFVISLLYASGIRLSELISLNQGQIVDKRFTVIGKGGKPRLCFIDDRTEFYMQEYLATRTDHCDALIVTYDHKTRMTATNVQLLVRNAAEKAGLNKKVTPHTLRHSYATNFLKNNGNMRYLAQSMGHASMDTTMMYAHVVDADLEAQYRKFHTI